VKNASRNDARRRNVGCGAVIIVNKIAICVEVWDVQNKENSARWLSERRLTLWLDVRTMVRCNEDGVVESLYARNPS